MPGGSGCWVLRWGKKVWPEGGGTREEFFLPAALPRQKFSNFALKTEAFPYFGSIWHNFRPPMAAEGGTEVVNKNLRRGGSTFWGVWGGEVIPPRSPLPLGSRMVRAQRRCLIVFFLSIKG